MEDVVREIPLEDIVIGKGQVRVRDVGKEIDELAASIDKMGLLEPIVVCPADRPGKFQILTGQRRFLAHRQLGRSTILATVKAGRVDEVTAKALSLTENLVRRDLHNRDKIDACTALYKQYGTIQAVADETGLPYREVSQYVKYDRLTPAMKKLVDTGEVVDIKTALRAQDAASVTGRYNEAEAVKFAKEMSAMSGEQRKRILKKREQNPDVSADDIIESAKTGEKVVGIVVHLGSDVHQSLQKYAQAEGISNQDEAAADLIAEALTSKGYLEE